MNKRLGRKGMEISFTMLATLLIGAVMIAGVFYIFFKANLAGERGCELKNIEFLGDLPNKISLMSGPSGYKSRDKFTFKVPCGDRAYFVNLDKLEEIKKSGAFDHEPLIKGEIEAGTGKNFFIMNGPKLAAAYSLGGLSLDYPYNICFDTKSSRTVKIEMEGLGEDGVKVIPECGQLECTQVPEELQSADLKKLAYTVCGGTDTVCNGGDDSAVWKRCGGVVADCYDAELQNLENAVGNLEVKLKVSSCFPEKTKVEFIIKPKADRAAKEVKFFETVPKECISNLGEDVKVEGGEGNVLVNPDPMLVWTFNTIAEEKRVSYEIPKILSDECRKQLKAAPAAELIVKKESAGKSVAAITDADIAPIDPKEPRQKHKRNVNDRKEHPPRLKQDTSPSFVPSTGAGFAQLDPDKKGQRVKLAANGRFEEKGEEDEGEKGTGGIEILFESLEIFNVNEPYIFGEEICPNHVKDDTTGCRQLSYSFEKIEGDMSCNVNIATLRMGCTNVNSNGKIRLKVRDKEGNEASKEISITKT